MAILSLALCTSHDKYLEEQFKTIELLRSKGYCAFFSSSLDNAMEIADRYMALKCEEKLNGKYLLDIT